MGSDSGTSESRVLRLDNPSQFAWLGALMPIDCMLYGVQVTAVLGFFSGFIVTPYSALQAH